MIILFYFLDNLLPASCSLWSHQQLTDHIKRVCRYSIFQAWSDLPMLNWGFNNDRCRIKWRCPHYKDRSLFSYCFFWDL